MRKPFAGLFLGLVLLAPAALFAATPEAQDYEDIGMAAYQKGLYAKSVEYFQKAVQADPNDWQAYQEMGDAYVKMNDPRDAGTLIKKVSKSIPTTPN